jgi:hypothetical protein
MMTDPEDKETEKRKRSPSTPVWVTVIGLGLSAARLIIELLKH